jgi:hypothetical protein
MNPLFHRSYRRKASGKTSATAKAGVPWPIFTVAGYMLSRQPQDLYEFVTAAPRAIPYQPNTGENGRSALTISCQRLHRHDQIAVECFQSFLPGLGRETHICAHSSV